MLNPDKAKRTILDLVSPHAPISVPLESCQGLVLQQDITATCPVPGFDNSAMDGYAVIADDLKEASQEAPVALKKLTYISAGDHEETALESGHCYQIATGAPVPPGADTVVMKEAVKVEGEQVWFTRPPKQSENVRYQGEDIPEGETVISAGEVLNAGQISLLAAFGYASVQVIPPIKVVVISTGSELVDVDKPLGLGQIHDTNSYTLAALAQEELCDVHRVGIVEDDPKLLYQTLKSHMDADFIIISGGVSVGEHDYVKSTLERLGVKEVFWRVSIKPGKPFFFGQHDGGFVFGMPGNPASSYVVFEEFVRPAIRHAMGYSVLEKPIVPAILDSEIKTRAGRRQFLRANVRREGGLYRVKPMSFQGSHSLRSLAGANALIIIPENSGEFAAGDTVQVRQLTRPDGE